MALNWLDACFLGCGSFATNTMKTTIVVLFLLVAATAFGQASAPAMGNTINFPDHALHAEMHNLGSEQSLVGGGEITYAQGERPLWEFGPFSQPVPLGDIARAYRQQKEKQPIKKSEVVLEKQGS